MDNECPECFGKKERYRKQTRCDSCQFTESCKLFCDDDGSRCDRTSGHVSYDRYSYSKEIAIQPDDNDFEDSISDDDDARQIMEYLLDIDNYTAELVSAVLHDDKCRSASALARNFGVSRQSIHRKLIDCCHLHPELRKLFITRLTRCRRILTNSNRIEQQLNKKIDKNYEQMELF